MRAFSIIYFNYGNLQLNLDNLSKLTFINHFYCPFKISSGDLTILTTKSRHFALK